MKITLRFKENTEITKIEGFEESSGILRLSKIDGIITVEIETPTTGSKAEPVLSTKEIIIKNFESSIKQCEQFKSETYLNSLGTAMIDGAIMRFRKEIDFFNNSKDDNT
jgi:hypothetical protein